MLCLIITVKRGDRAFAGKVQAGIDLSDMFIKVNISHYVDKKKTKPRQRFISPKNAFAVVSTCLFITDLHESTCGL